MRTKLVVLIIVVALLALALPKTPAAAQTTATCGDAALVKAIADSMNGLTDNIKNTPSQGAGSIWKWTAQIATLRQSIEDMNESTDPACAAMQLTAVITLSNINDYATLVMADKLGLVTADNADAYKKALEDQTTRLNKYIDAMNALIGTPPASK